MDPEMMSTLISLLQRMSMTRKEKRLEFVKANLDQRYGKEWQIMEVSSTCLYGKSLSASDERFVEMYYNDMTYLIWYTDINFGE